MHCIKNKTATQRPETITQQSEKKSKLDLLRTFKTKLSKNLEIIEAL